MQKHSSAPALPTRPAAACSSPELGSPLPANVQSASERYLHLPLRLDSIDITGGRVPIFLLELSYVFGNPKENRWQVQGACHAFSDGAAGRARPGDLTELCGAVRLRATVGNYLEAFPIWPTNQTNTYFIDFWPSEQAGKYSRNPDSVTIVTFV